MGWEAGSNCDGRQERTTQGSSVSFAYALSTGRVEGVTRIWADGRLIRDAEGQQAVQFSMRLHDGGEDQLNDPLIASVMGEALTPAFRGIAYLVFEDFDLSSFGNRLPLITVELSGGGDELRAEGVIADRLGLPVDEDALSHKLEGVALAGPDEAASVSGLLEAFTPHFAYAAFGWSLDRSSAHHSIPSDLWHLEASRSSTIRIGATNEVPSRISIRYFDPAIDFAAGEKSARVPGPERMQRIELSAAMNSSQAKAAAFDQLAQQLLGSKKYWLKLPLSFASIAVGDRVSAAASGGDTFRVSEKMLSGSELLFELKPQYERSSPRAADAGGLAGATALRREPLSMTLLELPGELFTTEPQVALHVSGGAVPFEPLPVTISCGGVEEELATASLPSSAGTLMTELKAGPLGLLDRLNSLEVQFEPDPLLTSCDQQALLAGENLLFVDGEYLQFATAIPLAAGRYRLSDLVRGRFDTEATSPHPVGSPAILMRTASNRQFSLKREAIGGTVVARVHGPDGLACEAELAVAGLAARPWAPCHLRVSYVGGDLHVSWIRRCKEGSPWLDGVDAPLGSNQEKYSLQLTAADGGTAEVIASTQSAIISEAHLDELGAKPWILAVRQIGDFAVSRSAEYVILEEWEW